MPLDATKATDFTIGDSETLTYEWSLSDGSAVDPSSITFNARKGTTSVQWTTGAGEVTDDNDGTGTWTITAGDLSAGAWVWWALATTSGGDTVIPDGLHGTITVEDR